MDTDLGPAIAAPREDRYQHRHEHGCSVRLLSPVPVHVDTNSIFRAGVCAIVKGVYVVQLRQQDFFYNGKDVTIWTAVETAVAIVGASIPVLRVFFREKVSSLTNSRAKSLAPSTLKYIPTTTSMGGRVIALNAMGPNKNQDGVWTRIEPIDEQSEDAISMKSRRASDEESGLRSSEDERKGSQEGIWQTTTITVVDEERVRDVDMGGDRDRDKRGRSWFN
jgi:hypothetical protein